MIKIDMTDHAPAVRQRRSRVQTDAIILHRFAADSNADGVTTFEEAVRFFTEDPEGIATVTLGGLYAEKVPTIALWRREGVPADVKARAFCPYTFLVAPDGRVARTLPLDVRGAHAGRWNHRSVGIAMLGRPDLAPLPDAAIAAVVELVRDVLRVYPSAKILSHDETLTIGGLPTKKCPGAHFPLEDVRRRARE